jgi:hypothetical protein
MTRALHRLAPTCLAVATAVTLAGCQRGQQAPNITIYDWSTSCPYQLEPAN